MGRMRPIDYKLTKDDVAIVLAMQVRGDRNRDIAAWFGVNQRQIKEIKDGEFASTLPAAESLLPPKGPPGIKGRRLRVAVAAALAALDAGVPFAASKAQIILRAGAEAFDSPES
jgi:hypothetical protein